MAAVVLVYVGAPAFAACPGDCNADATVTIAEVVHGVAISLSGASTADCRAVDLDGSATVTVDELMSAVRAALHGCPPDATATATTVIDPTPSPTPPSTPIDDPILAALEPAFLRLCGLEADTAYLYATTSRYYGFCARPIDDWTTLTIDRFDDVVTARDRFADAGRLGPPYDFAGFPAAYWQRGLDGPYGPGTRTMVWQLGCWVISVSSHYAYHGNRDALDPPLVSQTVLDVAGAPLLNRCPMDTASPTPTRAAGPDLVVEHLDAYAVNDTCQPYAVLSVCVANAASEPAGHFTVSISPGDDQFDVESLEAGAEACSDRRFPGRGSRSFTVTVDAQDAVTEADEANNILVDVVTYPHVEATCIPTPIPTPRPSP